MLTRERTILSLLTQVAKPLSRTVFVKLVFLLRHETTLKDVPSFYDFVPYNFGPFSFTLYWELERLRQNGYVTIQEEHVALCEPTLCRTHKEAEELTASTKVAVTEIIRRYGRLSQNALVSDVYHRYPYVGRCYRVTDRSSSIGKRCFEQFVVRHEIQHLSRLSGKLHGLLGRSAKKLCRGYSIQI